MIKSFLTSLILFLFFSVVSFSQSFFPKTNDGDYQTVTLFSVSNKADTAYSATYIIPSNAYYGVVEVLADTITTSDSLVIIIQCSPTASAGPWTTIATCNATTIGGTDRQAITNPSRYLRARYFNKGSAISNDFKCYLTLKKF